MIFDREQRLPPIEPDEPRIVIATILRCSQGSISAILLPTPEKQSVIRVSVSVDGYVSGKTARECLSDIRESSSDLKVYDMHFQY